MNRNPLITLATCATLALLLSGSQPAGAQEVNFGALDDGRPNMIQVETGAEYAFVAGVEYARVFRVLDRHLVLSADLRLPWAEFDFSDYRLKVGIMAPIVEANEWKLAGKLAPTLRGLKNDLARLTNLGLDLGLVGGYYASRWFVAGELGFDWAITTHVKHSAEFRSTVYEDAKSGWYAMSGGNYYYGLMAGYSFDSVDIVARGGQTRDLNFRTDAIPFYVTVGVTVRFGDI